MIFVCVSCGKKFLYRGDPAAVPPCKACGGAIQAEEPAAPPPAAGTDARSKELAARVTQLEADLQAREKDLKETRDRLATVETDSQEAGAQIEALQTQLSEAEDRQERVGAEREREIGQARARIAQLEKDLQTARSEVSSKLQTSVVRSLKEKETELHEAQASISRLGEELKKSHDLYKEALTKRDRVAEEHAAATAEAQASISRLGEELKKAQDAYKEALRRKDQELNEAHEKISSLEQQLAAGGAEAGSSEGIDARLEEKARDLERSHMRIKHLEKNVLDADQRYLELQKKVLGAEISEEGASRKDEAVAKLQSELAVAQSEAEQLRQRLVLLEQVQGRKLSDAQIRVGEARYLAADLDRSLESLATSLAGLVDRVRRLIGSLHDPGSDVPQHAIPGSPASISETPASSEEVIQQAQRTEIPQVEEPAHALPAEDVPVIDTLPAPEPSAAEEHLPADDTILEMGGGVRSIRSPEPEEPPPAQEEMGPPLEAVPMTTIPEEEALVPEPAPEGDVEVPPDEGGQYAAAPPPASRRPKPLPKKKGFFGKLFGG